VDARGQQFFGCCLAVAIWVISPVIPVRCRCSSGRCCSSDQVFLRRARACGRGRVGWDRLWRESASLPDCRRRAGIGRYRGRDPLPPLSGVFCGITAQKPLPFETVKALGPGRASEDGRQSRACSILRGLVRVVQGNGALTSAIRSTGPAGPDGAPAADCHSQPMTRALLSAFAGSPPGLSTSTPAAGNRGSCA